MSIIIWLISGRSSMTFTFDLLTIDYRFMQLVAVQILLLSWPVVGDWV